MSTRSILILICILSLSSVPAVGVPMCATLECPRSCGCSEGTVLAAETPSAREGGSAELKEPFEVSPRGTGRSLTYGTSEASPHCSWLTPDLCQKEQKWAENREEFLYFNFLKKGEIPSYVCNYFIMQH